ncbi:MAG: hypothetical protein WCI61_00995 [Chloroflexota bacterium]
MTPLAPEDAAALRTLVEDYVRAAAEVERLSKPDDLGSGERTARLSSLGAWEFQQTRILERIEALTGDTDIEAARARLAGG